MTSSCLFCGGTQTIGNTHVCGADACQQRAINLWTQDQDQFDQSKSGGVVKERWGSLATFYVVAFIVQGIVLLGSLYLLYGR